MRPLKRNVTKWSSVVADLLATILVAKKMVAKEVAAIALNLPWSQNGYKEVGGHCFGYKEVAHDGGFFSSKWSQRGHKQLQATVTGVSVSLDTGGGATSSI